MLRCSRLSIWFGPKPFESERFYERLGALLIKRYVPTGGDLVMRRLRRNHPERQWVNSSQQSLYRYERRTRLNEFIHVIGFVGFTVLIATQFVSHSLSVAGFIFAMALNLIFGLWPVVLQRYNRLRVYRAIETRSCLSIRQHDDRNAKTRGSHRITE